DMHTDPVEMNIAMVLASLGCDLADQHFMETPKRVAKHLREFNARPERELDTILKTFDEPTCHELVMVKDISFTALCAHHMLPFTGKAAVGYIPDGRVLGISKLARVTEFFARRLTLQERVTQQIADALQSRLQPKGVMVVLESGHQCMTIR